MPCMVRAYHVVFSTYGFWLPNDPRGSWSDFVRSWEIARFGKASKVNTRRSLAHTPHDVRLRQRAKRALKYPAVVLAGVQARAVGHGFAIAVAKSGYCIHACSILPQHVHLVVARHRLPVEQIIAHLKGAATLRLIDEGRHPLKNCRTSRRSTPTPWSQRKGWVVYLSDKGDIRRAIRYVEENPIKEGKRRQTWSFVVPFEA